MNNFTLPNGLKIPEDKIAVFAEARDGVRNRKDPEFRKSLIRDFVRENHGKLISIADFGIVAYGSRTPGAASPMIKKLLREKRLTRTHIRINGKLGHTYEWHDQRIKDPVRSNGEVKVIVPAKPRDEVIIHRGQSEFERNFDNYVFDFLATHQEQSEAIVGFRNWIKKERP